MYKTLAYQQPWQCEIVCPSFRPRQFEYHPIHENVMVFGTLDGEVVVADHENNRALCADFDLELDQGDAILGLCWLHDGSNRFVCGSSQGVLALCDARWNDGGGVPDAGDGSAPHTSGGAGGAAAGGAHAVVRLFERFDELTSVHVNSNDQFLLASGYSSSVRLYDLGTGKLAREFAGIHTDHINITRFAHHSPNLFATSSFDRTIKVWDLRVRDRKPNYTCRSDKGNVILCFSPDDLYLLTSAVDNEIRQYTVQDGREHLHLDVAKTGRNDNYTRSYYMNGGDVIVSGSSEERVLRLHCAHTGELLHAAELYPGRKSPLLYIQSLRGNPHKDHEFAVLCNYRDSAFPLEIVKMKQTRDEASGDNIAAFTSRPSTCRWYTQLLPAVEDEGSADMSLVARDKDGAMVRIPAHRSILAARCDVFRRLLRADGLGRAIGEVIRAAGNDVLESGAAETDATVGSAGSGGTVSSARTAAVSELERAGEAGGTGDGAPESPYSLERHPHLLIRCPDSFSAAMVRAVLHYVYTDTLWLPPPSTCPNELFPTPDTDDEASADDATAATGAGEAPSGEAVDWSGYFGESKSPDAESAMREWERYASISSVSLDELERLGVSAAPRTANFSPGYQTGADAGRASSPSPGSDTSSTAGDTTTEADGASWRGASPGSSSYASSQLQRGSVHTVTDGADVTPYTVEDSIVAASAVLRAANLVNLPRLRTLVEWRCAEMLSVRSVAALAGISHRHGAAQLLRLCVHFMVCNFGVVKRTGVLRLLPAEVLAVVRDALSRSSVAEPSTTDDGETSDDDTSDRARGSSGGSDDAVASDQGRVTRAIRRQGRRPPGLIPSVTGHTATIVDGHMVVLGGGNRQQFLGFCQLLVLDVSGSAPSSPTWSKTVSTGDAPSSVIYHATAALEVERPRHLLVFGGGNNHRSADDLHVLDTRFMHWMKPQPAGARPSKRTGHSMTNITMAAREGAAEGAGGAGSPGLLDAARAKREYHLVVFGGFSSGDQQCLDDVHLLTVVQRPKNEHGSLAASPIAGTSSLSASPRTAAASTTSVTPPPPPSLLGHVVTSMSSISDAASASTRKDRICSGDFEFSFKWSEPRINGEAPRPRLAHSATFLELTPREGGPVVFVFAGVGYGFTYNDVRLLNVGSTSRLEWQTPEVDGEPPSRRYGHSAVPLSSRAVAVFGGMGAVSGINDMHIAEVRGDPRSLRRTVTWSAVAAAGPVPTPRSRHTTVVLGDEDGLARIIVFGGSSYGAGRGRADHEIDSRVHIGQLRCGGAEPARITWLPTAAHVIAPGPEPPLIVAPSRLHPEMVGLLRSRAFCDVRFLLDAPAGDFGDGGLTPDDSTGGAGGPVGDGYTGGGGAAVARDGALPVRVVCGHRWLLKQRSGHFSSMLDSGMRESSAFDIPLHGVAREPFERVLEFLYTDSIHSGSEPETALETLILANEFMLAPLEHLCEGRLMRYLDSDNAVGLLDVAENYHQLALRAACMGMVLRHFTAIDGTAEFLALSSEVRDEIRRVWESRQHAYHMDIDADAAVVIDPPREPAEEQWPEIGTENEGSESEDEVEE